MSELQMHKETFKLIKSIEAASQSNEASPNNRNVFRYFSSEYIRSIFPVESAYTAAILNSLFLLRLSTAVYFVNFISVAASFFLKFQLFSMFSLIFALLIVFIGPTVAFFISHYPLIYSAKSSNNLFKYASLTLSLAGFILQSVCWCLMGLGLLSGSSGGIFTILNLLNSKEWPLFIIGSVNILILTASLIYSIHLEQFIFRRILLK
jgi:hypothetical protein